MKQTIMTLSSRYLNGSPMFVGPYRLTWLKIGATWFCVGMEAAP